MGGQSLDPEDWQEFRKLCHEALDEVIDYVRDVKQQPVWRPVPESIREQLSEEGPPSGPTELKRVYQEFRQSILPYGAGNIHPRFWGWVHGTGTAGGMLESMLAAAMNLNCGGRNHIGLYVERCVLGWWKQLFGFPTHASGLLTTGTSMANLIALAVARNTKAHYPVRDEGLNSEVRLIAYTSKEAHESVSKGLELLGIGKRNLRKIDVDSDYRINIEHLRSQIAEDRNAGLVPFCVVGAAGTVNTGAVDDLVSLATVCRDNQLWFHVDAAFGGLCILNESLAVRLRGIEQADSIAFDFHKWMYVQYAVGCVLVRDSDVHKATFLARAEYLSAEERGLAAGGEWPCDFGPDLSRPFYALKVWFAMKEHGTERLGAMVLRNCELAEYLKSLVQSHPELELVAGDLNIVCFRYSGAHDRIANKLNKDLVADIQESGLAAPSLTELRGRWVIRVAITNHRSSKEDLNILVDGVIEYARKRLENPLQRG